MAWNLFKTVPQSQKVQVSTHMFSIFKRPSVIHVDCFTIIPELPDLFPIVPASEVMPKWWKNLDPTTNYQGINRGTMKTCPGVVDYFKAGFIIPSWRDFHIEMNSGVPNTYPNEDVDIHHPSQWGEALNGYAHVKLVSPWRLREKTGVNFIFTNTFWHKHNHQMFIPNGIVNYKYQVTTNVNLVVSKNSFPNKFEITAGDPLVQCIPVSDKRVKLKLHVIDAPEYAAMNNYQFSFAGNYYKAKKLLERKGK